MVNLDGDMLFILNVWFQLKARGYTNIDALEPSEGMREKAAQKDIYHTFYKDLLSDEPSLVAPSEDINNS